MSSPLRKPEGISWSAASVELPPMPVIPPGADAMSMTISAVLPTLEASMTASVTSLAAKEETFSGKVGAAQSAYNVGDESSGQSVGQMGDMLGQLTGQLGQLSQLPQQAASSLGGGQGGGQGGGFGQIMQQAMQAAQGAVQQGTQAAQQGQGQGGPAGGPPPGVPGVPTPEQREDEQNAREDQQNQREDQQDERQATQDARDQHQDQRQAQLDSRDQASAGPSAGGSTAGPAPIAPHGPSRPTGGEDLSRQV
jgi:hypothetical protein